MKHLTKLALLGCVALLASACMREDVYKAPDNDKYDAATNTVMTKIHLDISTDNGPETKITSDYAQRSNNFLGMDLVHLLAYKVDYDPAVVDTGRFVFKRGLAAIRDYDLGSLFEAGDVTKEHSSRTVELALPLETNAVLFYGKAKNSTSSDLQGKVTLEGNTEDVTTFKWGLVPRLSSEEEWTCGYIVFGNILTALLVAGLVNEKEVVIGTGDNQITIPAYWSAKTGPDTYLDHVVTGQTDRRYRVWWPMDDYTPGANITKSNGALYEDGETYSYTEPTTQKTYTYTMHTGTLTWKQCGMMYNNLHDGNAATTTAQISDLSFTPLAESLGEAYSRLTNIKSQPSGNITLKELRAGSAGAILRTMKDLYAVVYKASVANPNSWQEEVARKLAEEIVRRMQEFFVTSGSSLIKYQSADQIYNKIKDNIPGTEWTSHSAQLALFSDAFLSDAAGKGGFPTNLGLPVGAAILKCDTYRHLAENSNDRSEINVIEKFEYEDNIPAYGMGTNATFPFRNYCYPAEIMYFGNSPLWVSDNEVAASEYPDAWDATAKMNIWSQNSRWTGWTRNGSVGSTTRSVAVRKRINYGTALLHSTIKFDPNISYLEDNRFRIYGEANKHISTSFADNTKGIKVTGIVVGGQPQIVNWQFVRRPIDDDDNAPVWVPATGNAESPGEYFTGLVYDNGLEGANRVSNLFDKMIYDKVNPAVNVSDQPQIFTLCWDNYNSELPASAQSDVYIALECVNDTGEDFWGELNMVRNGGTFYLVGKLSMDSVKASTLYTQMRATGLIRHDYFYPPYIPSGDDAGRPVPAPRVLMQDYETTANLVIGQTSLQHAYVTVPDLRASQVSLGVSIDLEWSTGLSFDVNMGTL